MKILAVTGARSEYDLLSSLYKKLNADSFFEFGLVVTGSHLSPTYGNSVQQIENDGLPIIERIHNLVDSDEKIGRILSLGNQIPALALVFEREKPDIVLVAGDREEAISVTMTAAYMDIPAIHFFGGDIAKDGNIDNSVRYAAGKFAHLHFVTLPEHKNTLIKLGEEEDRIHVVGNPAIDNIFSTPALSMAELSKNIGFEIAAKDYLLLIKHPIISEVEFEDKNMEIILEALVKSGLKVVINSPNSDAGNHRITRVIDQYVSKYPQFHSFKNLDRISYVNLMRNASALLGNSSSGLLEAPSLKLGTINIGNRQKGRIHGANVQFVDHDQNQILTALKRILEDENYQHELADCKNPYGDGNSVDKVIAVLKKLKITDQFIHKNITY